MTRANEPDDLNDRALRNRAVAAARGDAPFDWLLTGGMIFDANTAEFRNADIGTVGPLIASVHASGQRGDAENTLDASYKTITPGLIDSHMHVESSMITPATYAQAVVPRGVTTIVWDPHEFGNVHGLEGVRWAAAAVENLPLRVILLAPSCVPASPGLECAGAEFGGSEMQHMLAMSAIGGIAEVMNMGGVINRDTRMSDILQAGLASGKAICGHARGLEGDDLNAFMAAGISSDHELTSGKDLMQKLRAGLTIELRGSHDHLLPELVDALNKLGHLPSSLTLCTDDVFADDLQENGGLDDVLRRLVAYGMRPEWALQAATRNAALRLGRNDLGLIAAGRRADLAVFDDPKSFRATRVFTSGTLQAQAGQLMVAPEAFSAEILRNSVHAPTFATADFKVRSSGTRVKVATIDRPRFTQWGEAVTNVIDGFVVPPVGATLISVIHRHGRAAPAPRTGYLREWGDWQGAFCTTVSHDSHNLTVFGGNEADMATAANHVSALGGGMAVVMDGQVLADLALPLSGLVSDAPLAEVSTRFAAVRAAMDQIVDWQPPYLVFKACFGATLACNAGPHQTDMGIADPERDDVLKSPVLEVLS